MPRTGVLLIMGILLGAVLVSGCVDGSAPDQTSGDVAPPPSVTPAAEQSAVVRLSPAQARDLAVQTVAVQRIDEAFEAELPGTVLPSPEHFALVSAPIAGRLSQIWAHEGERVERGAPLAELESLEFANLAADFVQARAEAHYQAGEVERLETLVAQKITPRNRLDRARADLTRADAMVRAATARLRTLGIGEAQMESWMTGNDDRPNLVIRAPISGTIDRHLIDLGQSVTAYQEMMSIIDPSAVLVRGYLSPEDASAVHPGSPVCIEVNDIPDCVINTTVTTVNPSVDPENRAVTLNIIVATRDGWPLPGQTVRLTLDAESVRQTMSIPLSAVQYSGDQAHVFVRRDSVTYESRPVVIERIAEDAAVLSSGLSDGEDVAVTQVYNLKALARFDRYAEE